MFLQPHLQSPFGLSDVDLAAAPGDTIYHIGLFTQWQCILHFGQHRTESPPGLKDYSDVKLPANTPDVLTHPSHRPLNFHGATVRLTVSAVISRSHGRGLISHGLLSMSTKDLPILTRQEILRTLKWRPKGNNEGPRMPNRTVSQR